MIRSRTANEPIKYEVSRPSTNEIRDTVLTDLRLSCVSSKIVIANVFSELIPGEACY
jgi:hypothetical protein